MVSMFKSISYFADQCNIFSSSLMIYPWTCLTQEGLAAVFGNGLSTACVVNMGAQVTSVICIEVNAIFLYHFMYLLWLKGIPYRM